MTSRARPALRLGIVVVVGLALVGGTTFGAWTWRTAAVDDLARAERLRAAASTAEATSALAATLRSVRLDAAMDLADDRVEDLGTAVDRVQAAVARAQEAGVPERALAGFDAVARQAEQLSELGPEAGGSAGAWTPAALTEAMRAVGDALTTLVSDPSVGSASGQVLDRLDRALDADAAAAVAGIEVLRSDPAERATASATVVDARRRAQALASAAAPALPTAVRSALDDIDELEASDRLARELAALGDPETASTTDSGADRLHDAAGVRGARLAAVEREVAGDEVARADRAVLAAQTDLRSASTAFWTTIGLGPALLVLAVCVVSRRSRRSVAGAPTGPGSTGAGTDADADRADVAHADDARQGVDAGDAVDPAVSRTVGDLATLTTVVDRHQLLADLQLRVLDELRVADDGSEAAAVRRDVLVGMADRLALRARRLDESLLVLAGVGRAQRPEPSFELDALLDGARVESAAEQAIDVDAPGGVALVGDAALDLAHVVAELLANAAEIGGEPHGGPHGTAEHVRVRARRGRDGVLRLVIRDGGPMLDAPTLARLTDRAGDASPAAVAEALASGQLGLTTVAVLTARWGCTVRFGRATDGATEARLEVPARLVVGERTAEPIGPSEETTNQEEAVGSIDQSPKGGAWGWSSDGDYRPAEGWTANGEFVAADVATPDTLAGRVPEGADFEAGLASLLERDEASTDA